MIGEALENRAEDSGWDEEKLKTSQDIGFFFHKYGGNQ